MTAFGAVVEDAGAVFLVTDFFEVAFAVPFFAVVPALFFDEAESFPALESEKIRSQLVENLIVEPV